MNDGREVGCDEGKREGFGVNTEGAEVEGDAEGVAEGASVGTAEGARVGTADGEIVGDALGPAVVGKKLGAAVGR